MIRLPEGVIAALLILGLPIALFLEARRKRHGIGSRPYTWGYLLGTCGVIVAVACLLAVVVAFEAIDGQYLVTAIGASVIVVAYGLPGWFVIQRRRWAWVTLSFLTFNPLFWIIAYVYGKNRWDEFNAPERDAVKSPVPGIA